MLQVKNLRFSIHNFQKDYRIEAQYYFPDFKSLKLQSTREFVLEIEKLAEQIREKDILELRKKLKSRLI